MKGRRTWIKIRVSNDMDDNIRAYCLENHIDNTSEFIRHAIAKVLQPDIEDKNLVFESLQQLHGKIHVTAEKEEIIYQKLEFFIQNWFAYFPEIDPANIESAVISANQRFKKFNNGFKKSLPRAEPMLESIAADLVEEK
jgi:hypothetical protein